MMTAEQLAQFFHESYERLAPWFGYKTRNESAKPWANVPEQNRKLMTAVCAEVLTDAAAQLAEKEREIAQIKKELHRVYETNTVNADLYKAAYERAEAAEQRLQEAQAELDALRAGARTGLLKYCMAGDVGQFADRMRNLLQAENWNGLKNCVTDFFNYAKDRTEGIFPMHEAELAEVNLRLRQREAELEQEREAHEQIAKCLLPLVGTADGSSVSCAQRAAVEIKNLRGERSTI